MSEKERFRDKYDVICPHCRHRDAISEGDYEELTHNDCAWFEVKCTECEKIFSAMSVMFYTSTKELGLAGKYLGI